MTFLFLQTNGAFHQLLSLLLLVSAGQSDAWESESRKCSTLGAGGEGRGKASGHHDDEEKGKVPLRQDHVRKEEKSQRGMFHSLIDFSTDSHEDKTVCADNILTFLTIDPLLSVSDILSCLTVLCSCCV